MFFDSWSGLFRVIVVGSLAYGSLVILLRFSGKRTLAKLNAFDLVVTVALGSTLATVLLAKDVPLAEGVLAFALLVALQFVLAWLAVRSEYVQRLVSSDPSLLVYRGKFVRSAMRRERITPEEVSAALRSSGLSEVEQAGAVVLETDGSISVVSSENSQHQIKLLAACGPHGADPSGRWKSQNRDEGG